MLKSGIKRCFQWYCASFGPHRKTPASPQLLVLMYHRILGRDDSRSLLEEPGMVVTPDSFRMHMELVRQNFIPVQLCDWVENCKTGNIDPGLYCAVTFDDGWADNYENGYPILREFDIPAIIFLATDLIGTSDMFWPEKLSRLLVALADAGIDYRKHAAAAWLNELLPADPVYRIRRPDPEYLSTAIGRAKRLSDDEIGRRLLETVSELDLLIPPGQPSMLDWEQVSSMLHSGLIDIASHTRHHVRLNSSTPQNVMEEEIIGSKHLIQEKTGRSARGFCFPNGDYSEQALDLVRQHYQCAVSTQTGWNSCNDDMHLLKRIGIHDDAANRKTAFLAQISGWM